MAAESDAMRDLAEDTAGRWQAVDPFLPVPADLPAGCGQELRVAGPEGQLLAAGSCEHSTSDPDSLDLTWGAARQFQLTARAGGADVTAALDELLQQWRDHLATVPAASDPDTAAVVEWPSRDVAGPAALLGRGFAPLTVVAAADMSASRRRDRGRDLTVTIRRAGPADISAMVNGGLEVIRFDAHFGGVRERPSTRAALERDLTELVAEPEPWTWLAERDGEAVGMLAAERPNRAAWIAPMTKSTPAAYLLLGGVRAGERGGGIGAALAGQLHAQARAAGVAVVLLHYAQVNPLSAPFWSQQGYRPLWTCWEARPADSVR
jgi:ribosomal protein S18 acetylase RimI-like enzyme